jgi:hypothetical protein
MKDKNIKRISIKNMSEENKAEFISKKLMLYGKFIADANKVFYLTIVVL